MNDANVDAVIEDLRFRHGVLKPVPEGSAFAAGDWALATWWRKRATRS